MDNFGHLVRFFLYFCMSKIACRYTDRSNKNPKHQEMAIKVLYINQENTPYVPENEMSLMGKLLPQSMQERGFEIRTFMPKWGTINERRGMLHEVQRLSGMNLIIDDTDHPLIIKVASIPVSRLQVYFIDNEDYFMKRRMTENESGEEYPDNGERAVGSESPGQVVPVLTAAAGVRGGIGGGGGQETDKQAQQEGQAEYGAKFSVGSHERSSLFLIKMTEKRLSP